jgi:hypothetical protein
MIRLFEAALGTEDICGRPARAIKGGRKARGRRRLGGASVASLCRMRGRIRPGNERLGPGGASVRQRIARPNAGGARKGIVLPLKPSQDRDSAELPTIDEVFPLDLKPLR